MLRKIKLFLHVTVFLIIAVLLEGCFAGLVAGTWKEKTLTGADPVSYVIEKDRTLVFTMKWDGKIAYEKAETKEEALQDPHLYYLQEDTFILKEKEYTRQ